LYIKQERHWQVFGQITAFGCLSHILNLLDQLIRNLTSASRIDKQLHSIEVIDKAFLALNIGQTPSNFFKQLDFIQGYKFVLGKDFVEQQVYLLLVGFESAIVSRLRAVCVED
jgi:hypothetical protein